MTAHKQNLLTTVLVAALGNEFGYVNSELEKPSDASRAAEGLYQPERPVARSNNGSSHESIRGVKQVAAGSGNLSPTTCQK
jgi:hypothetical protein